MSFYAGALAGFVLLLGIAACVFFSKKTNAPVFRVLGIVFSILAVLLFAYCAATMLLVFGID